MRADVGRGYGEQVDGQRSDPGGREQSRQRGAYGRGRCLAARERERGQESPAQFERFHAGRDRAVPVPGGIVRFNGENQPSLAGHTGHLGERHRHIAQMLQHRHTERAIERAIDKGQAARIG